MSAPTGDPADFGHDVLGPIVAEFCLRLWSLSALMARPDDAALLFCARGGLRMQLAHERFLAAAGLESPLPLAPLMVSRVAAVRPALARTHAEGLDALPPAVASTLGHEFRHATLAEVVTAVTGVDPGAGGEAPYTPEGLVALLRDPARAGSGGVVETLSAQADLLVRHLHETLDGRRHAVLVDTGLYGTTRALLAEGVGHLDVSSALLARSFRPGSAGQGRTVGLSVQAADYVAHRRRTALLRYWHFVEWLFEPDLPSVRTYRVEGTGPTGVVRSDLEVPGWADRVAPAAGSPFAGVLAYLDALPPGAGGRVVADADAAWDAFRRAVVWPRAQDGRALAVGTRSHDFGLDGTWSAREGRGALAALRGSSMWREGEIAASGSPWRRPLLAAVETAYALRRVRRRVRTVTRPGSTGRGEV